jgi:hypothetical protein
VPLVVLLGCLPAGEAFDPRAAVPTTQAPAISVAEPEPAEAPAPSAEAPPAPPDDPAAVVVVLDGTRWQDIFLGADPLLSAAAHVDPPSAAALTPHLHALLEERGAAVGAPEHGPPMTASGPNFVSLPGYTEIFGGHRRHPCGDNDCPKTRTRTVFDEVRERGQPGDVAVFSSWERIARAATVDEAGVVLSCGRSRLSNEPLLREDAATSGWLEEGRGAAAFPGKGDFRPDRFTAGLALRYLESKRPRLLFLGLGEPDEYAHRGDYAGYLDSLRFADAVIGRLFEVLDRMGSRGERTTVFVTADHGRARDWRFHGRRFPESSRVWLVAAGAGIAARGLVPSSEPHHLADLAPTLRVLLALPADTAPAAGTTLDELFVKEDG